MNELTLKIIAELKALAVDGLSIDISEKTDGSVSVVFHQSSEEIDLDPPTEINCFGSKYWKDKDGLLHRDGDLPAAIYADGSKYYYKNGNCHRDGDLPAIEHADGTKCYYKNGNCHRDGDLPAIEHADGTKCYYKNGKCHRDGDLPAIEYANGERDYYKNGKPHRDGNKPAIIRKNRYEYCLDGKLILIVKHKNGVVEI